MILKLAKVLGLVCAVGAVISGFVLASLDTNFVSYPKEPQPSSQKTIAHNVKGTTVYITPADHKIVTYFYYLEIVSLCSLAAIALFSRGKVVDADWPWKKR